MRDPKDPCRERLLLPLLRRPANALVVEVGEPLDRCRLKTPEHWGAADPRASRWLLSGGDAHVLGLCSASDCPKLGRARGDAQAEGAGAPAEQRPRTRG